MLIVDPAIRLGIVSLNLLRLSYWFECHENLLFEMHEGRTARITSPLVITSPLTQIGFKSSADLSMRLLYSFRTYLFRDSFNSNRIMTFWNHSPITIR